MIARGHKFQKIGRKGEVRYGYAAAITIDVPNRRVEGGAEPRRSHAAVPFTRGASTTTGGADADLASWGGTARR